MIFLNKAGSARDEGSFRSLKIMASGIDFSSNDYLGIAKHGLLLSTESHFGMDLLVRDCSPGIRILAVIT